MTWVTRLRYHLHDASRKPAAGHTEKGKVEVCEVGQTRACTLASEMRRADIVAVESGSSIKITVARSVTPPISITPLCSTLDIVATPRYNGSKSKIAKPCWLAPNRRGLGQGLQRTFWQSQRMTKARLLQSAGEPFICAKSSAAG